MRWILFFLVLGTVLPAFSQSNQQCDSLADFSYEGTGLGNIEGFLSSDVISCIQSGKATEMLIPFTAYETIPNGGNTDTVTQIVFDDLTNLPCGLCWGMNKSSHTYGAGETGCIVIKGITTSAAGQYTLDVQVTLSLAGGGTVQRSIADIAGSNGKIIVRIIDGDDSIPSVNYGITGNISSNCN